MLENPWVVGIGGGIVSGLVVFLFTNFVVNKVSKKEYFNKVKEANREIIVLLIMSVSEERIPSLSVINSLLKSLARSYRIKESDLNGIKETLEDLIKEIFETKFISNDKKNELSESLILLIEEHEKAGEIKDIPSQRLNMNVTYVYALATSISILLMITTLLVIINPIIANVNSNNLTQGLILPFVLGAGISVLFLSGSFLRGLKKKEKAQKKKLESQIDELKNRMRL